jgi:hypothetical protein
MKKILVFLGVFLLIGCAQTTTVETTMSDSASSTNGLYAIFVSLYVTPGDLNHGIEYLAADLSEIPPTEKSALSVMLEAFCEHHNLTYLEIGYDDLVAEGYIVAGGFANGLLFTFSDVEIETNHVACSLSKFRGNLASAGSAFTALFADGEWTVNNQGVWVS